MKEESADNWVGTQIVDFLELTSERSLAELHQRPVVEQIQYLMMHAGPWRPADRAALAGLGNRTSRRDEYRRAVSVHPIAKLLAADERFRTASTLFEAKRKKAKKGLLADPLADVRFLHAVAEVVSTYKHSQQYGSPRKRKPLAKTNLSALGHAHKLATLMDNGVRLRDGEDNKLLRGYLDALVQELRIEPLAKPGPNRADRQRKLVRWLVRSLNVKFGAVDVNIVSELAAIIDYEPDASVLRRLIRNEQARIRRRDTKPA